jgi:spermidine synthase
LGLLQKTSRLINPKQAVRKTLGIRTLLPFDASSYTICGSFLMISKARQSVMNPWVVIDEATVPGDGGEMKLLQRTHEYTINVKNEELMNSRLHGSEDALAELACKKLTKRRRPKVLIGGLGMGYTLGAALENLGPNAKVVVAELVPAVIKWNRTHLADLAGRPLEDPRVIVREGDVGRVINEQVQAYDAILLDVDNGPEGLTHDGNDRLYTHGGLDAAKKALKQQGILAVWSAHPDKKFTKRLRDSGFDVEEVPVRARGDRGRWHMIWLAEKK